MRSLIDCNIADEWKDAIGFSTSRMVKNSDGSLSMKRPPFAVGVKNASQDGPAEIALYGEIGNPFEMCDAGGVAQFVRAHRGQDINVRINSMGGLAYDGIAIHNTLAMHDGQVTTIIEGMAGSAASIIAVGGHKVQIFENAHFFIHCAAILAYGRSDVMMEAGRWVDQVDDALARTYKAKTNKAIDKLLAMMRGSVDGTNFTAREAVDNKFADEVVSIRSGKSRNDANSPIVADASGSSVEAARAERVRKMLAMGG